MALPGRFFIWMSNLLIEFRSRRLLEFMFLVKLWKITLVKSYSIKRSSWNSTIISIILSQSMVVKKGERERLKLVIFFSSNFLSRLKWCVTGRHLGSCPRTWIILLIIRTSFSSSYPSVSLPCWLREQKLRKFNSKDFASDERKIENEIVNYSVSHKKSNHVQLKRKRNCSIW